MLQQIDIPVERQFRMMAALHQNLNSAYGREFVEFLIDLLERKNVMILVFFGSIKRTEFAVNIADVRVINVAIDDIGDDFPSVAAVAFRLRQITSHIGKRAEFFERPAVQLERVVCRNPFAREDFFRERISIDRNHGAPSLAGAGAFRTYLHLR